MAENNKSPNPQGGDFMQVVWQNAALVFMLYLLVRWVKPSILPEFMREARWYDTKCLFPCVIGGAILTGIFAIIRIGAGPPKQK